MTSTGIFQIALFFVLILACTKPLGVFMTRVFDGERTFLHPVLRWLEVLTYKVIGVQEEVEQRWTQYTAALISFSIFGFLLVYFIQRAQGFLPLNPQGFNAGNVSPDLAFNTSASFITNTNWQAYSGESTMSYFVQMAALTVQNFASAAAGIAVAIALVRGFVRQEKKTIGNFWVDVTRATVYVLLPMSIIAALLFCSMGVIQNLHPYTALTTVEGAKQVIAQGPVASQEAIKQLGTNGGGFFNANSAHPFENPTPLSNLLQMFLIFVIPAALTYTFGRMVKDTRQGWAIFAAFSVMFVAVRTNPLVHGQTIPLVVVPQFSYYGKRFFIDNLDPGVTLLEGESNTLSLVASPGYDRVFFYRSDLQNIIIGGTTAFAGGSTTATRPPALVGTHTSDAVPASVPDRARKVTYLAGPEWTFKHAGISGQLDFLHEITGRNHGDEVRAAIGIPLGTALGGTWRANVGATWKSAAVVNYYYGYRGLYDPNWALDPFAKIGYSRPLGRKWTFDAFVHCERLGNAIASSPIVDRHYVTTAFLGATYLFHR